MYCVAGITCGHGAIGCLEVQQVAALLVVSAKPSQCLYAVLLTVVLHALNL
jgi:hypothetical protein